MIRNRNDLMKRLDDHMLQRWENEGGALCPSTIVEHAKAATAEFDSRPMRIDSATNDYLFEGDRPMLALANR